MKKIALFFALSCISLLAFSWGATGHRVTGYIAEKHLSKKAKLALQKILGQQSLAIATNWMDEIRSDSLYNSYATEWHWVTIETGQTYDQSTKNAKGDAIQTIERIITELKSKKFSGKEEADRLRILIHLIGDIHQPLHVGFGDDRGGNRVKVNWFDEETNLHSVWDSHLIDFTKLSYTELAESLPKPDAVKIKALQNSTVRDWANESMTYRKQVYAIGDGKLSYKYHYKNYGLIQQRLMEAGIRMAGVLNDIYGK